MNKKAMEERGIAAYRYDCTKPKFKNENGKSVPDGTITNTYYLASPYPLTDVDLGNYWDFSDDDSFYLCDASGNYILDEEETLHEWAEISDLEYKKNATSLQDALEKPFDFVEIRYGNKKDGILRITALPERPRVCAEKCDFGDIGHEGLRRIRIYGKSIHDDGILTTMNRLWISDLRERMLDMISEKAGRIDGVTLAFCNGSGFQVNCENDALSVWLDITAPDLDTLKRVLTNLGAKKINESYLNVAMKTGNTADGSERIHARIIIGQTAY